MTCPHNFKTSYDVLRDDCRECTGRQCLLPGRPQAEWYGRLLDELEHTIAHHQEMAMEVVRECWWNVGETIARMREYYEAEKIDAAAITQRVAQDLKQRMPDRGISKRTFQYAIAFYKKFPDKEQMPCKSWKKIIEEDLTAPKALPEPCQHLETITVCICKDCGKRLELKRRVINA